MIHFVNKICLTLEIVFVYWRKFYLIFSEQNYFLHSNSFLSSIPNNFQNHLKILFFEFSLKDPVNSVSICQMLFYFFTEKLIWNAANPYIQNDCLFFNAVYSFGLLHFLSRSRPHKYLFNTIFEGKMTKLLYYNSSDFSFNVFCQRV